MSNDGLIIENMDVSHIHLAVQEILTNSIFFLFFRENSSLKMCQMGWSLETRLWPYKKWLERMQDFTLVLLQTVREMVKAMHSI